MYICTQHTYKYSDPFSMPSHATSHTFSQSFLETHCYFLTPLVFLNSAEPLIFIIVLKSQSLWIKLWYFAEQLGIYTYSIFIPKQR